MSNYIDTIEKSLFALPLHITLWIIWLGTAAAIEVFSLPHQQAALLVAGSALVGGLLLFGGLHQRSQRLLRGMGELASGAAAPHVALRGGDELALLARSFNTLARRINARQRQQASQMDRLDATIAAAACSPWEWHTVGAETEPVWLARIHPHEAAQVRAGLQHLLQSGSTWYADEYRLQAEDGSYRQVLARGRLVTDAVGQPLRLIGLHIDITARHQQEEARLARASELQENFLLHVSHELNTSLNVLRTFTGELLQTAGGLNEQQRDWLAHIDQTAHRLLEEVTMTLDLARIELGKFPFTLGAVPVAAACRASLALVEPAAHARGIAVRLEIDPTLTTLHANRRRLQQILTYLLDNAVQFTPMGGTVRLAATRASTGNAVQFTISDSGIGMAPEDIALLFVPFVQAQAGSKRPFSGPGLGLTLVARLVWLHSGTITIESQVGQGSQFTVTLPLGGPSANPSAVDGAQAD